MNTAELQDVMKWLKTTDLVEVSYKRGEKGFALSTADSTVASPGYPTPAGRYTPVCSPGVGILQWSELGRPRKAEEGASIAAGEVLGLLETARGQTTPITSPCDGRIARLLAEAGAALEFGQPILFLEPLS